ncbi:MAG: ABC transporter ATP-binding protein [Lachnospiraceae bacterium]|nr:ABC transporter ATP-binding protein [Lachnospiraceae bacterium]
MTEPIVKLHQLSKKYGKTTVLSNFDLTVERGRICGLIGPNGAGKTTLMKLLAGLTLPTGGSMELFGGAENIDEARRRMSFMIEAPILDPGMTARENLRYIRYLRGVADEKRIDETLAYVGLADVGKKPVKNFSLGMKQRLGIAMALLPRPEILVLDEPVNGLDPEGIVEIRRMLKTLAEEQNVTVLISSHLLSELSELCTDFTLMNHGKVIESFPAEELQTKCRNHLCIRTDNIDKTAAVLETKLSVREYKVVHGEEILLFERLDDIAAVSKAITDSGLVLTRLESKGETLEEYYLSKVGAANE